MARSLLLKKIKFLIQQAAQQEESIASSRREFLKTALLTSATIFPASAIISSCTHGPMQNKALLKNTSSEPEVIILGAGIAGLTAAYRLTQASVPCAIYEASPRVGGRMFTKTNFNSEGMTCELGGELVDTNHEDLIALCQELGIALDEFSLGDKGLVANLYYFQQTYRTDKELIPLFQPFARRLRRDQKKIKDPIVAKKFDQLSLEQYLAEFRDVEKWIIDLIRVAYIGEFGLEASEQSALNVIYVLSPDTREGFKMYGESDEAKKIRGGNIALIQSLEKFLRSREVPIYTNMPILKIAELSAGVQITIGKDTATRTMMAKRVICTIPFSVLRHIEGVYSLSLSPLKKKCLRELAYATCGKMMIGYQRKIWREGLHKEGINIPASNGMVYSDLAIQSVWESSRTQLGNSGILTSFTGGKVGANLSSTQYPLVIEQINEVFPGTKNIYDNNFAAMNWTHLPYNLGSYSSVKRGQATEFSEINWLPDNPADPILFAGEHTADRFQGFMNGACRSGNRAAAFILSQVKAKAAV